MAAKKKRARRNAGDAVLRAVGDEARAIIDASQREPHVPINISNAAIARAAKAAYERFVKEAGYEHDARIREWGKLSYTHQARWAAIARAVLESVKGT